MFKAEFFTACAEKVLSFIADVSASSIDPDVLKERIADIADTEEYEFVLRRYEYMALHYNQDKQSYPKEELRRVFLCLAQGKEYSSDNEFFEKLHQRLLVAQDSLDAHFEVLAALKRLDQSAILLALAETLPENASFDTRVYFVPEIHTNAYVFEGNIVISFFPLALKEGSIVLKFGEGTQEVQEMLCHELHHIALNKIQEQHLHPENLEPEEAFLLELVLGTLGEGLATHFFTKPKQGYLLELWNKTDAGRLTWFKRYDDFLTANLADPKPKSMLETEAFQTFVESSEGTPPIYIIGTVMCEVIEKHFGRTALVNLIENPRGFLELYNKAASLEPDGYYVFPDSLLERLSKLFDRAWM